MNRIEFCAKLIQCRQEKGVSKNEMCRLTKLTFSQFQRVEGEPNNFSIDKAFLYLNALGMRIVLRRGSACFVIDNIESVAKWLTFARKDGHSLRTLATEAECSFLTIINVEQARRKVRIDIFLKLVEALDYALTIEPNE